METDATYRKGYKQGVLDATKPVSDEKYGAYQFAGTGVEGLINSLLKDRRTQLLLRKTTKWVIVHNPSSQKHETGIYQGRLWDSYSAAERYVELGLCPKDVNGVYPIEIEEPI